MAAEQTAITLKLVPVRDTLDRPVPVRLRAALKFMLRSCGLRCVTAAEALKGSPRHEEQDASRVSLAGASVSQERS